VSGVRRGAQGGATGSVESSAATKRRRSAGRRRQEDRWAAMAGPVEVRSVSDDVVGPGPGALQAERAHPGAAPDPVEPPALG
jgi:hypothetical protein